MAAKRGRPRKKLELDDDDDNVGVVDLDPEGDELPDDLLGSLESDGDTDPPDEPPEGWPS